MALAQLTFGTDRALVKPWRVAFKANDSAEETALAALLEPAVLKSLPPPLQVDNTPEDGRKWIADRLAESVVLAVLAREKGALIGAVILAEFESADSHPDVHLGYLLTQAHWGKGLASEIINSLVVQLSKAKGGYRLLGGVEKSNPASARVLIKAGFALQPQLAKEETEMFALET